MPYYETIEADLARAKAILVEGRAALDTELGRLGVVDALGAFAELQGGTIYGKDIYAAYMLLESFVDEIERLQRNVDSVTTANRKAQQQLEHRTLTLGEEVKRLRADPEPTTHCADCQREYAVKTTLLFCMECLVRRENAKGLRP